MGATPVSTDERGNIARLLVSCPDRHGIVAAVSGFLFESDANILSSDQHSTDPEGGTFFMRMEFRVDGLRDRRQELERAFAERIAGRFEMAWRFAYAGERKRVALLASRDDHCLLDLLWRQRRGELDADVVAVVSNHPDHAVNDVIRHPSKPKWLFIATDVGVFRTTNLGKTWIKVGANLPLVPITDIDLPAGSETLYAATYGRSVWTTSLADAS